MVTGDGSPAKEKIFCLSMMVVVQMRAERGKRRSDGELDVVDDEHTSFLQFLKWERGR